jgi:DNA transposition AAA+ family ATPase
LKKILSITLALSLFFLICSSAYAAEKNSEIDKINELIAKTNTKINEKIEKAVEAADELQARYLEDIRKLEEENGIGKLMVEKENAERVLNTPNLDQERYIEVKKLLTTIEEKMIDEKNRFEDHIKLVENEVEQITSILVSAERVYSYNASHNNVQEQIKEALISQRYEELTVRYVEKLDQIIMKVYNETYDMATRVIEKAAGVGITLERSWVLVRFADRYEWIDPIRVVGR